MRILNTEECSPREWLISKAQDDLKELTEDFHIAIESYENFIKKCPEEERNTRYFTDNEFSYRCRIDSLARDIYNLDKLISEHPASAHRPRWKTVE